MLFDSLPSFIFIFFFNDTATTEIYTLSLHDALPIYSAHGECADPGVTRRQNRPHQVVPGGDGKRKSVRRTREDVHRCAEILRREVDGTDPHSRAGGDEPAEGAAAVRAGQLPLEHRVAAEGEGRSER